MPSETKLAEVLRASLDDQVRGWKAELESLRNIEARLLAAQESIAELESLLQLADTDDELSVKVAERPKPSKESSIDPIPSQKVETP